MNQPQLKKYHAHKWDEPLLMELSTPGERGVLVSKAENKIIEEIGEIESLIPENMLRKTPPNLPELSQPQILRHFLHLSQMTLGTDVTNDIGLGTCTMKYSPKIHEQIASSSKMTQVHPYQDENTIQGILEILYKFGEIIKEISGMDEVSFQPGSGAQAIFTNTSMMRAYHNKKNETQTRKEIITTMFSHPTNAACPSTLGYDVISLMPENNGLPSIEALKESVSDNTAGLLITNPEDTGIFNPNIKEFIKTIHDAGGLCIYDQANANGILGKIRAKDIGFDMCHFNLHKTFSSPHGSMGPACGAVACTKEIAKFLPTPIVRFDGNKYFLDYNRPQSIGKIKGFFGNVSVVLRAYLWVISLGTEGLNEVAETAVINNNYLQTLLMKIKGVSIPYDNKKRRLDQIRYSWEKLKEDTGVGSYDIERRMTDYGLQSYWTSHYPWIVPEPFTPEPCESYSLRDIEYWAKVMEKISKESYENPEIVKNSPHNAPITRIDETVMMDAEKCALTYKQYMKMKVKLNE